MSSVATVVATNTPEKEKGRSNGGLILLRLLVELRGFEPLAS